MKLKLNKEELVTLSDDAKVLADELTPHVGGAGYGDTDGTGCGGWRDSQQGCGGSLLCYTGRFACGISYGGSCDEEKER